MRTKLEIRDTDNSVIGAVDIGKDENFPFTLTKKLASLKDISKRGGAYSKTFKVPATKENNRLLHYLYSSNQKVVKGFKQRKTANILVDETIVERGYVKITDIEKKGKTEYYVMSFFGDNVQWMTDLAETDLTDLTYTNNTQTYNASNIISSWSGTYSSYDHVYPFLSYGQYENGYGLTIEDFFPALYYKAIVEKSLNKVGFTLSSTFMDGDFEKLIFPYIGDGFQHPESLVADKLFRASSTDENRYYCDNTDPYGTFEERGMVTTYRLNDDSTSPNFDTGSNFNTTTYRYTISTTGKYRFKIKSKVKNASAPTLGTYWSLYKNGNYLETIDQYYSIANVEHIGESGYYRFISSDTIEIRVGIKGIPPVLKVTNITGTFVIGETITGGVSGETAIIAGFGGVDSYGNQQLWLNTPGGFGFQFGEAVTTSSASAEVLYAPGTFGFNDYDFVAFDNTETSFELIDMSRQLIDGNTYNIDDVMPEINVLDLFADLTKLFNLYWLTDNKTKTVYVEPRDSFFGGISDAIDWTDKLNVKSHTLKFITDYKRDLLFRYVKDDADKYMNNRNETMGGNSNYPNGLFLSYKHTFPDRFQKGTDTLSTEQIAPTYMIHDSYSVPENSLNYGVTSAMWNESGSGAPEKFFGFKPRILNYRYGGQTFPDGSTLYIDFNATLYSSIPSALAVDVWSNTVPISLAFGQSGLFDNNYARTMALIEDGTQLEAYFNVSERDYQSLDIRKPIYLNSPEEVQGYWLIDTISDYSPFKPLTKVILMKYHNQAIEKVTIDTNWTPPPFPTPTTGDYPVPPKEVITKGGKSTDTGDRSDRLGVLINNGTGNQVAKGSGSVSLGQGCVANYKDQSMLGRYPEATNDIFAIGTGTKEERLTGLRVSQDGDVTFYGGEVLVVNDNGERVPIFIEGTDKMKKIYLK